MATREILPRAQRQVLMEAWIERNRRAIWKKILEEDPHWGMDGSSGEMTRTDDRDRSAACPPTGREEVSGDRPD